MQRSFWKNFGGNKGFPGTRDELFYLQGRCRPSETMKIGGMFP